MIKYLDLSGKKALVGGSTQGIGLAIAKELAKLGATVTLLARDREKLQIEVGNLVSPKQVNHDFIVVDFSDPSLLKEKVANYIQQKNGFHILINNTGGPPGGKAIDAEIEEFYNAFRNHLICNQILTKLVVPGMIEEKYGRIINIISTSVKQPIPNLGVSNTIRGAVANWAKTLSSELGEYGITVNNVLPGMTRTQRLESIISQRADAQNTTTNEIENNLLSSIPARRFADASEIAFAVGFLASPAAAYINGINLPVDGGRTKSL